MLTDAADKASAAANVAPKIDLAEHDGARLISLSGRWISQSVSIVDKKMRELEKLVARRPLSSMRRMWRDLIPLAHG